jgi:hypothetical protein
MKNKRKKSKGKQPIIPGPIITITMRSGIDKKLQYLKNPIMVSKTIRSLMIPKK